MELIKCSGCKRLKTVDNANFHPGDIFRGTILCNCGEMIFFELEENCLTFVSGKHPFGILKETVPKEASGRFGEAKLCYFSGALRASAVMARSGLERGLAAKGFNKGNLEQRIEDAHKEPKRIIGDVELALAHGTRLIGNDAIHEAENIEPGQIEGILGATVQLLNKVFA